MILFGCLDLYKRYEGNDNVKLIECLSISKNDKIFIKDELVEKYKSIDGEVEHNRYYRSAESV